MSFHVAFLEYNIFCMIKYPKDCQYLGVSMPQILSSLCIKEIQKLSPSTQRALKSRLSAICRFMVQKYQCLANKKKVVKEAEEA